MQWMGRAWRGEEKLWKVFWVYGVLGNIAFSIFFSTLTAITGAIGTVFSIEMIVAIPFLIFLWVSQWRCAFNADGQFWGYLVRVLIVLGLLGGAGGLASLGISSLFSKSGASPFAAMGEMMRCQQHMAEEARQSGMNVQDYQKSHQDEFNQCFAAMAEKMGSTKADTDKMMKQMVLQQKCQRVMTDYAEKTGSNVQLYMFKNRDYLMHCTSYLIKNPGAEPPAIAVTAP